MRDPKRLDNFYDTLKAIHMSYFPDWRFGQLFDNFRNWLIAYKGVDIFFPEEDAMIQYVTEFANLNSG